MKKAIIIMALLLIPALVEAKMFYITQGMGCESWVVFLSSRADYVDPEYDAYGSDGTKSDERLQVWAKPRDITFWPAA